MLKLVKNSWIADGVIDGFKAPDKIFSYLSPVIESGWVNDVCANCYFNNLIVVKPDELNERVSALHEVLLEHAADGDEEEIIIMVWKNKTAAMIGIISSLDGVSYKFNDDYLKFHIATDMDDNSPSSVIADIDRLEPTDDEKAWLIQAVKDFTVPDFKWDE